MSQQFKPVAAIIAQELKVNRAQVEAAIYLLDEGSTVPFIARYRKEATQGLDDTQLRLMADRLRYVRDLDERRTVILKSIREQEKLTQALEQAILAADSKTRLEDLYLPFRPKRRSKASVAKEAGLEPLANALWQDPALVPEQQAAAYVNPERGVADVAAALEGARQILMEHLAEDADLLAQLRQHLWQHGLLQANCAKEKKAAGQKFADYFDYQEPIRKIPSHRALALFRGRREHVLQLKLTLPDNQDSGEALVRRFYKFNIEDRSGEAWIQETLVNTWKLKLFTKLELELLAQLREAADEEAIHVFARNLRDLLLAAPAGAEVTMGLDPGIRTGVKVAVVDATGKLLDYSTIFPFAPQNQWHESIATLAKLAARCQVNLISIGNGTASRETERLVAEMIKTYPDLQLTKVVVNEAGASVYSASALAAEEFPELDVTIRGAVSIARRLQDPLAELVKIEPRSIGVGQYQHDVNQSRLARSLEAVVEDCVNAVGVDVNTASVSLLTRVSGLNAALAKNIVAYRDEHGAFRNREALRQVARMGDKTFQQAAGFLRISSGDNPLDASAVHPEAYPLVERIISDKQVELTQLIGNKTLLNSISAKEYVDDHYGLPTVKDVLQELEKPGRDPRPEFKTARFKEGVEDISHLQSGMMLEGVVSNVTNFGAFVDIGVHQDGLVHISEMTTRFISDPHTVVKAGDIVQVKVIEIDQERHRIGLSMRLDAQQTQAVNKEKEVKPSKPPKASVANKKNSPSKKKPPLKQPAKRNDSQKPVFNTAMADALAKLKRGGQ